MERSPYKTDPKKEMGMRGAYLNLFFSPRFHDTTGQAATTFHSTPRRSH